VLDRPIKAIGMHEVKVALHPEVSVTVKVNVARSPEEADLQAQGIDVLQQMFEEEAAPLAAEALAPADEAAETVAAEVGEAAAESTEEAEQPEG
jgi:large subunit ribosomal protein L9